MKKKNKNQTIIKPQGKGKKATLEGHLVQSFTRKKFSQVFTDASSRYDLYPESLLKQNWNFHQSVLLLIHKSAQTRYVNQRFRGYERAIDILNRSTAWMSGVSLQGMLRHACALGQRASRKENGKVRDTAVLHPPIIHFLSFFLPTKAISVVRNSQWELASLRWYVVSFFCTGRLRVEVGW